uniref:Uncharacterized protein n=1 Tax=Arundo donax TaxID=35708 RepID=A0A0A9BNK0_ARUDO
MHLYRSHSHISSSSIHLLVWLANRKRQPINHISHPNTGQDVIWYPAIPSDATRR